MKKIDERKYRRSKSGVVLDEKEGQLTKVIQENIGSAESQMRLETLFKNIY